MKLNMLEIRYQLFYRTNSKSLVDGIGNETLTEKYYDNWALNYDQTLKNWNYKAPLRAINAMS